jgi:prophage tail gpP-like protein
MLNAKFEKNDVTLVVSTCTRGSVGLQSFTTSNSRTISGWTNVRVSRGVERCPSDFEVSFTEPFDSVDSVLVQPGDEVEVYFGSDLLLSGFVDRYMPSFNSREHIVRITGRSRCQDLVDCSAHWSGGQLLNMPLLQVAKNLCAVYGITVNLAPGANQGDPIPQLNIMVGEPIYDVLERLCRFRGLLLYDQPDGSLFLSGVGTQEDLGFPTAIGTKIASSALVQGVNVLSASALYSMDGRFSDYDAVYQGLDTCQDVGDGGNLIAHVADGGVPRFRYRAIVSEHVIGGAIVAEQRAKWEMARRLGRSFQVRVTTDTWRDSDGVLWTPNTGVNIDLPGLKLKPQTWLISDVTYKRNEGGTTADLVIMPPQAFFQEPIILNPIAPDINSVGNVNK